MSVTALGVPRSWRHLNLLPTLMIIGRPNVGKSALFNRRREALVFNTPDDHVPRDIREGLAKLGALWFKVLDSAGFETEATSGSILSRTASMTANVLARTQFAIFLIDVRGSYSKTSSRRKPLSGCDCEQDGSSEGEKKFCNILKVQGSSSSRNSDGYAPGVWYTCCVHFSTRGKGPDSCYASSQRYIREKWCLRLSTARLNRWLRKLCDE
ncbi:hypothetical protein CCACVL1_19033 [Corchorus capsularis]|uniref:G domain-containing protein n=1 Tax=Corchorus capsularis TaxID=210143 RepID=A0A1R3HIY8_COCAP|nr:hypothetical protein CCACVL1_19033 [Corchorus capsularis]